MKMLDVFGTIKTYVILALGVSVGGLVVVLKIMAAKTETLEAKVKLEKQNAETLKQAINEQEQAIDTHNEINEMREEIASNSSLTNRERLQQYARSKDNQSG